MSLACVGSTRSVPATLGLPSLAACVLPPSTLLRLQPALQGTGPELCVLPRPKPLRFRFSGTPQKCRLGWACVLCLPRLSCSGSQELDEHTLPRCSVPYPLCSPSLSFRAHRCGVPCVSSGKLVSGCDSPGGCQPSRISGSLWLETGSLFAVWWGMQSLGPSLPLSPPPCLLPPAFSGGWAGLQPASSLVFLQSFVLGKAGSA